MTRFLAVGALFVAFSAVVEAVLNSEQTPFMKDILPEKKVTIWPKDLACEQNIGAQLYSENQLNCDLCTGFYYGSDEYYGQCMAKCFGTDYYRHCKSLVQIYRNNSPKSDQLTGNITLIQDPNDPWINQIDVKCRSILGAATYDKWRRMCYRCAGQSDKYFLTSCMAGCFMTSNFTVCKDQVVLHLDLNADHSLANEYVNPHDLNQEDFNAEMDRCRANQGNRLFRLLQRICNRCTGWFSGSPTYYGNCVSGCFQSETYMHCMKRTKLHKDLLHDQQYSDLLRYKMYGHSGMISSERMECIHTIGLDQFNRKQDICDRCTGMMASVRSLGFLSGCDKNCYNNDLFDVCAKADHLYLDLEVLHQSASQWTGFDNMSYTELIYPKDMPCNTTADPAVLAIKNRMCNRCFGYYIFRAYTPLTLMDDYTEACQSRCYRNPVFEDCFGGEASDSHTDLRAKVVDSLLQAYSDETMSQSKELIDGECAAKRGQKVYDHMLEMCDICIGKESGPMKFMMADVCMKNCFSNNVFRKCFMLFQESPAESGVAQTKTEAM